MLVRVTHLSRVALGSVSGAKRKERESKAAGLEADRKAPHLSLQVPLRSHSSSSSEETSSSSAAQPLLAADRGSPSSGADDQLLQTAFPRGAEGAEGRARWVLRAGTWPAQGETPGKRAVQVTRCRALVFSS